jgi:hypothetical protein
VSAASQDFLGFAVKGTVCCDSRVRRFALGQRGKELDPFLERCLVGHDVLKRHCDAIRGHVHLERFEMLDPQVQVTGCVVVLSYRFDSWGRKYSTIAFRWNATEEYRLNPQGRRIIHRHWSLTKGA